MLSQKEVHVEMLLVNESEYPHGAAAQGLLLHRVQPKQVIQVWLKTSLK